jgi:hypothetical protein
VNMVRVQSIHLLVHHVDQVITGVPQNLKMLITDGRLQDEITFIAELHSIGFAYHGVITHRALVFLMRGRPKHDTALNRLVQARRTVGRRFIYGQRSFNSQFAKRFLPPCMVNLLVVARQVFSLNGGVVRPATRPLCFELLGEIGAHLAIFSRLWYSLFARPRRDDLYKDILRVGIG